MGRDLRCGRRSKFSLNFPSSGVAGGLFVLRFGDEPDCGPGDEAADQIDRYFQFQVLGLESPIAGEIIEKRCREG